MARIRTVKPELFRHELLYQIEKETGLPARIAWVGLFTICDKAGRFEWRPKHIKLDVLPWDDLDFEVILNEFHKHGLILRYEAEDKTFGCIPTWASHQIINNREGASNLPDPAATNSRVLDACPTRAPRVSDLLKGKGREGKGKEREGEVISTTRERAVNPQKLLPSQIIKQTFLEAWENEFGKSYPGWGAKENNQANNWIRSLTLEKALQYCKLYPKWNDPWVTKQGHPFGVLVSQYVQLDAWSSRPETVIQKMAEGRAAEKTSITKLQSLRELEIHANAARTRRDTTGNLSGEESLQGGSKERISGLDGGVLFLGTTNDRQTG